MRLCWKGKEDVAPSACAALEHEILQSIMTILLAIFVVFCVVVVITAYYSSHKKTSRS